ncbi:hypothetical protein GW7_07022 [Heterocephalus glaber]|uniref:Uncharacterized protein n=1 Tax=Heterocephalus glaber TaxID=10181 RepID=G5AS41_HETGA|nr:hypothetical protein GW7_07022 [Heterocephalus glaber]
MGTPESFGMEEKLWSHQGVDSVRNAGLGEDSPPTKRTGKGLQQQEDKLVRHPEQQGPTGGEPEERGGVRLCPSCCWTQVWFHQVFRLQTPPASTAVVPSQGGKISEQSLEWEVRTRSAPVSPVWEGCLGAASVHHQLRGEAAILLAAGRVTHCADLTLVREEERKPKPPMQLL